MPPKLGDVTDITYPHSPDLFQEHRRAETKAANPEAWQLREAALAEIDAPHQATGVLRVPIAQYITDDELAFGLLQDAVQENTLTVVDAPTGSGKTTVGKRWPDPAIVTVPTVLQARQLEAEGYSAAYGGSTADPSAEKIVTTYDSLGRTIDSLGERAKEYVLFIDEPQEITAASTYRGSAVLGVMDQIGRCKAGVFTSATTASIRKLLRLERIQNQVFEFVPGIRPPRTFDVERIDGKVDDFILALESAVPVVVYWNDKAGIRRLFRKLVKAGKARPDEIGMITAGTTGSKLEAYIEQHGKLPQGIRYVLATKKIVSGLNIADSFRAVAVDGEHIKPEDLVQLPGRGRGKPVHLTVLLRNPIHRQHHNYSELVAAVPALHRLYHSTAERDRKFLHPMIQELATGGRLAAFEICQRWEDRQILNDPQAIIEYLTAHGMTYRAQDAIVATGDEEVDRAVDEELKLERDEALALLDQDPARAVGHRRAVLAGRYFSSPAARARNVRGSALLEGITEAAGEGLGIAWEDLVRDYIRALEFLEHHQAIALLKEYERLTRPLKAIRARQDARQRLERKERVSKPYTVDGDAYVSDMAHAFEVGERYTRTEIETTVAQLRIRHNMDGDRNLPRGVNALEVNAWYWGHQLWTFQRRRKKLLQDGRTVYRDTYEAVAFADHTKFAIRRGLLDLEEGCHSSLKRTSPIVATGAA
jgi:hypothetical protein